MLKRISSIIKYLEIETNEKNNLIFDFELQLSKTDSEEMNKKIMFNDISKNLLKVLNLKEILAFKRKFPINYNIIKKHSEFVRLKTRELCI